MVLLQTAAAICGGLQEVNIRAVTHFLLKSILLQLLASSALYELVSPKVFQNIKSRGKHSVGKQALYEIVKKISVSKTGGFLQLLLNKNSTLKATKKLSATA